MKKKDLLKGSQLFALARSKARQLEIDPGKLKLEQLIREIQQKEGHQSCFRKQQSCTEMSCCWQLSCGAVMSEK